MATVQLGTEKVFGFVIPVGSNGELIKQSIVAVMTALFLVTVLFLFVFPRFADLVTASKKVSDLEAANNNLAKTLDALDSFKQNVNDLARESVYLAIPNKFDPGYILLSLRKLASENQVNLVTYNLAGGELKETIVKNVGAAIPHSVRLEISGSPLNLINFVDTLDRYLPIASVSELLISEISKVILSGASDSKLSMSLNFYHMPLSIVTADSLSGKFLTQRDLDNINSLSSYKRLGTFSSGGVPAGVGKENLFGL
ncbi:hypothetical protein A3A84_02275 [Candidatus Collierbacteria bacterium RIFCSPLOWO2_01_FULL_50_23]|uniref:Uncharacterized protein n=2 Tax=Candidatus Collieribacteriota TaxID=1752725 RepID=A0A1F5EXE5_9BACT|nr:MAG: hypothetical protein A2703_02360 [Candidatus Collierbacteria bacterium RIFCSPHIGHO2_01_FULL_50_25]OGD72059.1 MAG: hypothetical protein A3D09_02070 [Candidatus Collierbacteria bacterium RIFCSPHIGHO2_02_FULL_49_10]OGD73785.1 MAG: hypothetical protein A3A84_02275 [Candidatus Collierbacteria bacterium RIFCSPLOWO2_01_FULL_50_23]